MELLLCMDMTDWVYSNQRVILRLKFNAGVQSVKRTCHVPVDKHRSICNAPACRLRSPLARRRRDVGSGKQEEPYSCASPVAVVSTQASALAFSGGKLSGAVDFTRLPDSDADTPDLTWEKVAVHSRGFWVSCGVICRVGRWGAKCDVFHGVLFWQTLGLWLPGQLTGFSTLANTDVIPVRRPSYHYIITLLFFLFNQSWLCHECSLWRTMVSALSCFIVVCDGAKLLMVSVASRFKFEQKNPKHRSSVFNWTHIDAMLIILTSRAYWEFYILNSWMFGCGRNESVDICTGGDKSWTTSSYLRRYIPCLFVPLHVISRSLSPSVILLRRLKTTNAVCREHKLYSSLDCVCVCYYAPCDATKAPQLQQYLVWSSENRQ